MNTALEEGEARAEAEAEAKAGNNTTSEDAQCNDTSQALGDIGILHRRSRPPIRNDESV